MSGVIYLLHFANPLHHAKHYLGSSAKILERLMQHATGDGARITSHLARIGADWQLAALFQPKAGSGLTIREIERLAKEQGNGPRFCPICNPKSWISPRWTQAIPIPNLHTEDRTQWQKTFQTWRERQLTARTIESENPF